MVEEIAKGRPSSALDIIIAAIAEANDCIVVTDNEKGLCRHRDRQSSPEFDLNGSRL
jgi:predicted nucleic acid-binding protein